MAYEDDPDGQARSQFIRELIGMNPDAEDPNPNVTVPLRAIPQAPAPQPQAQSPTIRTLAQMSPPIATGMKMPANPGTVGSRPPTAAEQPSPPQLNLPGVPSRAIPAAIMAPTSSPPRPISGYQEAQQRLRDASKPVENYDANGKLKPEYRMGIGQRILGSLINFASGFSGRGGPTIHVGPGATNRRYQQEEAERQDKLAAAQAQAKSFQDAFNPANRDYGYQLTKNQTRQASQKQIPGQQKVGQQFGGVRGAASQPSTQETPVLVLMEDKEATSPAGRRWKVGDTLPNGKVIKSFSRDPKTGKVSANF